MRKRLWAGVAALALCSCGSGLGEVTVQDVSSADPSLPRMTVSRLQDCFSIYGGQLQPGHHDLNPVVEVDRDGRRRTVKTPDMPDTAPDLAACTRIALGDMAIPSSVLDMRSTQSVASASEPTSGQRLYLGNPAVAVVVVVGLSEIVLEAGAYTILFGVTVKVLEKAAEDVAEGGKAHCAAHYATCMATSHGRPKLATVPVNTGKAIGNEMTYIDPPSPNHPHRETTEKDLEATLRIESVLIRNPPLSFEEMLEEYRTIEADLVEQAGDDEFDIIETKRRIAEWILTAASWRDQPFDVCKKAWDDLFALGFTSRYMKCNMACVYADCCLETEQAEAGLAMVEPVIAELEDWLAATTIEPNWRSDYESGLVGLKKRRDKLKAGIDKSRG